MELAIQMALRKENQKNTLFFTFFKKELFEHR